MEWTKNMVSFFTYEKYHNKRQIGSTTIRVHNLIKHWPDAKLYEYAEKPDVIVFQKVYMTADFDFPKVFDGIKILDICDPDWLEGQKVKETIDVVDGVTCPTQAMAEFIRQLTDKPVKVIKDRFDLDNMPKFPKTHTGKIESVAWFGYSQNADLLKTAVPYLARNNIKLTIYSNYDPNAYRWAKGHGELDYTYKKYQQENIFRMLKTHDAVILPKGYRPQDRFKSENKTIVSHLLGVPAVTTVEALERLHDTYKRNVYAKQIFEDARTNYDCVESVKEYKEFIDELTTQ